jgi:hypothetical protein
MLPRPSSKEKTLSMRMERSKHLKTLVWIGYRPRDFDFLLCKVCLIAEGSTRHCSVVRSWRWWARGMSFVQTCQKQNPTGILMCTSQSLQTDRLKEDSGRLCFGADFLIWVRLLHWDLVMVANEHLPYSLIPVTSHQWKEIGKVLFREVYLFCQLR